MAAVLDGVIIMYKKLCVLLLVSMATICGGCKLLDFVASDIGGWDLSACVGDFDTCYELYSDNADKFEGEFVRGLGVLDQ